MSRPGKRNGYRCFASRRRHGSVRCEISGSGGTSANNSRFLILPDRHSPNLASRILSLCEKRLPGDWLAAFGHPLLLIETFVDPQRFRGTIYQAAIGYTWDRPKDFAAPGRATARRSNLPRRYLFAPCRPMRGHCYPVLCSISPTVLESPKSC